MFSCFLNYCIIRTPKDYIFEKRKRTKLTLLCVFRWKSTQYNSLHNRITTYKTFEKFPAILKYENHTYLRLHQSSWVSDQYPSLKKISRFRPMKIYVSQQLASNWFSPSNIRVVSSFNNFLTFTPNSRSLLESRCPGENPGHKSQVCRLHNRLFLGNQAITSANLSRYFFCTIPGSCRKFNYVSFENQTSEKCIMKF